MSAFIATHPRLVVSKGVVEPEPDTWPPLKEQWQLLGSLWGLIGYAQAGRQLSWVVKPLESDTHLLVPVSHRDFISVRSTPHNHGAIGKRFCG